MTDGRSKTSVRLFRGGATDVGQIGIMIIKRKNTLKNQGVFSVFLFCRFRLK